MVTHLLMKHRDIDFHIYTEELNISESVAIISELAQNSRIKKVSYTNLLDCEDCCLEWHAWYEDDENNLWQLDMMHILKGSTYDGFFEDIAARIKAKITDQQRMTILSLKYETPDDVKIAGIEYYKEVMKDGVADWDHFCRWREINPLNGIENWHP